MTPCLVEEEGYRIHIFTQDHGPAHVHVTKAGGTLKASLQPVRHVKAHHMKLPDQRRAMQLVRKHQEKLLAAWETLHGQV